MDGYLEAEEYIKELIIDILDRMERQHNMKKHIMVYGYSTVGIDYGVEERYNKLIGALDILNIFYPSELSNGLLSIIDSRKQKHKMLEEVFYYSNVDQL